MRCPKCYGKETKVTDSRLLKEENTIRRRRECLGCHHRFTTYERLEESLPVVIKKDGRREAFNRNKILAGINKALEKRPISFEERNTVVSRIERELMERGDKEIESKEIGEMVIRELHSLDEVAYVRFASVYRSFTDITDFMNEVKQLLQEKVK